MNFIDEFFDLTKSTISEMDVRTRLNKFSERSKNVTKSGIISAIIMAVAETIHPFQFLGFSNDLKSF